MTIYKSKPLRRKGKILILLYENLNKKEQDITKTWANITPFIKKSFLRDSQIYNIRLVC